MPNTILVVEDEKGIHEVISEYLKEAGFNVLSAYDGRAAHDIITGENNIDVFILDIMLPHANGLELLKTIRAKEKYKETPVIMLTALNDEYTQLLSFDGLADDYITKPFSPKILVKRVHVCLRRSGHSPANKNTIILNSIMIDSESYEAYEDGEKIHLTLREFELLKTFMSNQKRALSRQQLLNEIWGYDFFGDERIVDVHIKNLRKKFKTNIVTTVKGVGYKSDLKME
jgi:DNA-binding response OmpR family regulator